MTLTSATATEAVVNHHLGRFAARDLQGVVADYAPGAVLIVPTGVLAVCTGNATLSGLACGVRQARRHVRLTAAGDRGRSCHIRWSRRHPITLTRWGPIRLSSGAARSWCRLSRSRRHPRPDVRDELRDRHSQRQWRLADRFSPGSHACPRARLRWCSPSPRDGGSQMRAGARRQALHWCGGRE